MHKTDDKDADPIPARTSNGLRKWTDLPFFFQDFYNLWCDQSPRMSADQRYNLSSFVARLASVGICDNIFAGFALIFFRDALETPVESASGNAQHETPVALLGALSPWLVEASHKIKRLVDESFDSFDNPHVSSVGELAREAGISSPGFSPARWSFWKKRLSDLQQSAITNEEAQRILHMINDLVEREID